MNQYRDLVDFNQTFAFLLDFTFGVDLSARLGVSFGDFLGDLGASFGDFLGDFVGLVLTFSVTFSVGIKP